MSTHGNPPQGLAPEVMQALVEHFAAAGAPQRVERVVLHLSIASLDLDQVLRAACMNRGVQYSTHAVSLRHREEV